MRRFVDPSDPSRIFLTQPVPESERLNTTPSYAAPLKAAASLI